MKENITGLKLISGEELICMVESEETDSFVVSKPMTIVPAPDGMALVPFCVLIDTKVISVRIPKSAVLIVGQPIEDVAQAYNAKFGDGIVTPPQDSKLVLPPGAE
jgi:hypothetical protein